MKIAGCDETGPEDGHDVSRKVFMIANEFCAVPKRLYEHGHHDELGRARCETLQTTESCGCALEGGKGGHGTGLLNVLGIEGFDGVDVGEGGVN